MLTVNRLVAILGLAMLLSGCTAAGSWFDNNCSGNGGVSPGSAYCEDYTAGP